MRLLRARVTLRLMMAVVAAVALGLAVVEEFRDGLPPRFVVRDIPGRIARLRAGMTREETYGILGIDRSWLVGGLGASDMGAIGMHQERYEHHGVRGVRILLVFSERFTGEGRLVKATASSGSTTIAEMPGSRG